MAQKTRPEALRLKELKDWHSRGFYGKRARKTLQQDFEIRKFLEKRLNRTYLENIEIERFPASVNIIISTSRPGIIIGRRGEKVSSLKEALEKKIPGLQGVKIEIRPVKKVWCSAKLTGEWIASQLEKRMPFRRVLKQAVSKVMKEKEVEGVRVQVSGRLNGVDMARTEWLKQGKLKRQTIRSDLDYAFVEAKIPQGILGIKVWIYKGEKL
jgi:small subunit ribosomal protein S3